MPKRFIPGRKRKSFWCLELGQKDTSVRSTWSPLLSPLACSRSTCIIAEAKPARFTGKYVFTLQSAKLSQNTESTTQTFQEKIEASSAATAAKSLQSCPTLCDPIDSSPPLDYQKTLVPVLPKYIQTLTTSLHFHYYHTGMNSHHLSLAIGLTT